MFSDRLKELRKSRGLTQVQFAEIFHIAKGTIGMWESGKREPDFETAQKIADFFEVTVDDLIGAKTKAPTHDGERSVSDDDIKFALFGGGGDITDAMYDEVKRFAQMVKLREEAEKKG